VSAKVSALKKVILCLEEDEDPRTKNAWHRVLQRENPGAYQELVDVIKEWISGGEIKKKLRTKTSLYRFFSGKDPRAQLDDPPVSCSYCGFCRFLDLVQNGDAK